MVKKFKCGHKVTMKVLQKKNGINELKQEIE